MRDAPLGERTGTGHDSSDDTGAREAKKRHLTHREALAMFKMDRMCEELEKTTTYDPVMEVRGCLNRFHSAGI